MSHDYDVVVIGAGPVGATALAFIGHAGIRAVGVERDLTQWTTARAVHFDGETIRTLQGLGLSERASALLTRERGGKNDDECQTATGEAFRHSSVTASSGNPADTTEIVARSTDGIQPGSPDFIRI